MKRRKNNAVFHGLQEPAAADAEERKTEDELQIMSLLHDIDCDDISVDSVIRLGRIPEADDEKPRPILLRFPSEEQSSVQVKKLEDDKSGPNREDIHPPGSHTEAEGMSAEISGQT